MIITPFAFHYAIFSKDMKTTKFRPEVFLYSGIIVVSTAVFYLLLSDGNDSQSNWVTAAFHVVSASTTSGFQFIDVSLLSADGKTLLIVLMLIGGTAFSTAGGIKAGRILQIFLRLTRRNFAMDNAIRSISSVSSRYNESYASYGKKTEELRAKKALRESLAVVVLFLLLSFITALVLFYLEQRSFMDSLFESVSALITTCLSS